MIERFPEGTFEIPHPYQVIRWKTGEPSLIVQVPPSERCNPPKIVGWKVSFVGFYGYDKPFMSFSYKPEPVPEYDTNDASDLDAPEF